METIQMLNHSIPFLCLLIVASCRHEQRRHDITAQMFSLKKEIYDSVQLLVDANNQWNNRSEVYVLEPIEQRNDTSDFVLTTLLGNEIPTRFSGYLNCFNDDSSLLLVPTINCLTSKDTEGSTSLSKIDLSQLSNDSTFQTFNPLKWKLTITSDHVILDRTYGQKEAEKSVIIPVEKFKPH